MLLSTSSTRSHWVIRLRTAKSLNDGEIGAVGAEEEQRLQRQMDLGPIVVFACRHMFHRRCLERSLGVDEDVGNGGPGDVGGVGGVGVGGAVGGMKLVCPSCD